MRKYIFFLLAVSVCIGLGACSDRSSRLEIEYLPVRLEPGQTGTLVGSDGAYADAEFKGFVSPVVNGFFTVKGKNGYDVYRYGQDKPVEGLSDLYRAGHMSDGLIPVRRRDGGELEVTDDKGKVRFKMGSQVSNSEYFTDGMLLVDELDSESYQTRWGAVNSDGELTVPMKYDKLYHFNEGCATASLDGKWMLLDHGGDVIAELDGVENVSGYMLDGRMVAFKDGQYGFCNRSGKFQPLGQPLNILDFNGKYAIVNDASRLAYGVVDTDGESVIPLKYKFIQFYGSDRFVAQQSDGVYLLLDSDGSQLAEIHEKGMHSFNGNTMFFSGDFLVGGEPGCYYLYGADGRRLNDTPFYQLY